MKSEERNKAIKEITIKKKKIKLAKMTARIVRQREIYTHDNDVYGIDEAKILLKHL